MAAKHGLDVEIVEPRDLPWVKRERANLIIDWDFIPDDYRSELMRDTAFRIVAIHGYTLADSLITFLTRGGIACSTRLDYHLFEALAGWSDAACGPGTRC